jgi:hypothetical protein
LIAINFIAIGKLSQSQVNGINYLLDRIENDTRPAINNKTVWMRQIAYTFASIKHEVRNTYESIPEDSNTMCKGYDGGCRYKGRGYIQLTHRPNYVKFSKILKKDLVANPDLALNRDIAYFVTSYGLHYGSFTGVALGRYIRAGKTDYYNARRVVNRTDKANLIKGYAIGFQHIMEQSTVKL